MLNCGLTPGDPVLARYLDAGPIWERRVCGRQKGRYVTLKRDLGEVRMWGSEFTYKVSA